jgi:hypothetical protein
MPLVSAVVVVALTATLVHGVLAGLATALPYLLPPLLLLLVLVLRRYPGERALLTLMARNEPRHARARLRGVAPRWGTRVFVPRGGRLIASSLAVRPPPPALSLR